MENVAAANALENLLHQDARILILAPHPDDECLGTGGLIQQALAKGAKVKVIFITNGDNNPWPQRYLEKIWFIVVEERARWGQRRKIEAENSEWWQSSYSIPGLTRRWNPKSLERRRPQSFR